MAKKVIRVALVDCGEPAHVARGILRLVEDLYEVEFTSAIDTDYVFHSCMGYDVLRYSGVRIFVTGEMVSPNFNISDYALSFDPISLGDRHLWFPLIKLYGAAYQSLLQPRTPVAEVLAQKTGFCAYVMSNTKNSAPERVEIFDKLNAYQPVSSGGRWRNTTGGPVKDKIAFQRTHKFAIAFENHSHPGYLTEKFAQAAYSDCVPIYWGDPRIAEYFNPQAFINCHDFADLDAVAAHVAEVDQDPGLYEAYLTEPWFRDGIEPRALNDEKARAFLQNIFDPPLESAYRRNRARWGQKHARQLDCMWRNPLRHALERFRNQLRGKR